jgi:transketolase
MLSVGEKNKLTLKSLSIKKRFIEMYYKANAGHIGSSLSCTDILTFAYFNWMQETDELILSKGHAAAALYSLLAEDGVLSTADIDSFYKNNTYLSAHPPANKINKIRFATGSLGHGLSLAAGLGMAAKLKNSDKKIMCVTSDGELNEGSTWEAALFITHHQLKNIVWFVDRNKLQGFGKTEDVMRLEPLDKKLEAFGFDVSIINGHDFDAFYEVKQKHYNAVKPIAVICNTIKGNGWMQKQDELSSHYLPFNELEYKEFMEAIDTKIKAMS